jgi:hypothetical protein
MAFPIIPRRRSAATGNPTSLNLGELAVNTLTGELFLGADAGVTLLNGPVASGTTVTEHTGDGTSVAFTFGGYNGTADGGYIVSVGGIDQPPSKYSINNTAGGTITFVEAPVSGELISIRAMVAGSGGSSSNATQLQGRDLSDQAPDDRMSVTWNQALNTWQPSFTTELTGVAIDSTTPTDTQILAYNATSAEWAPSSPLQLGTASTTYGGGDSIRLGDLTVSKFSGIAIGTSASANPTGSGSSNDSIVIGNSAAAYGAYGVSIGNSTSTDNGDSIAIGRSASAIGGGIALGATAAANANLSISATGLTTGAPSNQSTPVAWLNMVVNGTQYYLPLYQ